MVWKTKQLFIGKHSQLDGSLVWPKPIAQAISLEKFPGYRSIHENRETFPPQTICNCYGIEAIFSSIES